MERPTLDVTIISISMATLIYAPDKLKRLTFQ